MKLTNSLQIAAACVAGYIGGVLSRGISVKASPPETLRATRFELVNGAGAPVATWQADPSGGASLIFLRDGRAGITLRAGRGSPPFVAMSGKDGKPRLVMELDLNDSPMLDMGDGRWEGRVHLGFMPPDTFPYSNWDYWGLVFRAIGSEHAVAAMGMKKTRTNPAEPFLTLGGKSLR